MVGLFRNVALTVLLSLGAPVLHSAAASEPYQGSYVIIDPYNPANIKLLTTASTTSCAAPGASLVSPFCGATNGILLRTGWCSFQLYHANAPSGQAYPSCHYVVGYSNGAGSPGQQVYQTDNVSPCPGTYDICANSVLGATLALIAGINTGRATAQLPPLKLALGLSAGIWTPQSVLDKTGTIDVPDAAESGQTGQNKCVRLPLVYKQSYTTAYGNAVTAYLRYIAGQTPLANVSIVKIAGITVNDLELEVPGRSQPVPAPADPGPAGPGPLITCTATAPAQTWLDAYNQAPVGGKNFSEANEWAFGTVVGHEYAELANLGIPKALLSIPTTGASGFADVDCGSTGASACSVSSGTGNWPIYYLELYVDDLFNGGLAHTAAAAAYQAAHPSGSFALPPDQLGINWTGLSTAPIVPSQQVGCTLNNTNPALAPSQRLNGQKVTVLGAGTTLGWQTQALSGALCLTGQYQLLMTSAVANGGLYLEVQTDAAFTDLPTCSLYLSTTLAQIMLLSPPTACAY
jgi:hypothetical protein